MTDSRDRAELLMKKNMYADICCELKETICRLNEDLDGLHSSELKTGKGSSVMDALRRANRMRREYMDLIEEINADLDSLQ